MFNHYHNKLMSAVPELGELSASQVCLLINEARTATRMIRRMIIFLVMLSLFLVYSFIIAPMMTLENRWDHLFSCFGLMYLVTAFTIETDFGLTKRELIKKFRGDAAQGTSVSG